MIILTKKFRLQLVFNNKLVQMKKMLQIYRKNDFEIHNLGLKYGFCVLFVSRHTTVRYHCTFGSVN